MKKILIVGAMAGGATAAARLRRLNEEDEIILFERGEYVSLDHCGLPYYMGDVFSDRQKLQIHTKESLETRFNLDLRNFSEVKAVYPNAKLVDVKDYQTGEIYQETYDKLILSPGTKSKKTEIKGLDKADNVFSLKNMHDADQIKEMLVKHRPRRAVVVGGGYGGLKIVENLQGLGINVTLVEKENQVLKALDFELAQMIHQELNANCVNLILADPVDHFQKNGHEVVLKSGMVLEADCVILEVGNQPENELAKSGNFKLGLKGHIKTSKNFEVFDAESGEINPDIFVIGDAAEQVDFLKKKPLSFYSASLTIHQGRILADYINGISIKNKGTQATSVLKVFNKVVARTGYNKELLDKNKLDYQVVHAYRSNHASYYPGSATISLKAFYDPKSLKILGVQGFGQEGTEKRIDVIATAMNFNATIEDLMALELSYAPPFSSPKDPVNILGYIAQNINTNAYKTLQWDQIDDRIKAGLYVIDVRTEVENQAGTIEGSVNIELNSLRDRIDEIKIEKDQPICVFCQVGHRAYLATRILKGNGFTNVYNLSGGYTTYKNAHYIIAEPNFTPGECRLHPIDEEVNVDKGGDKHGVVEKIVHAQGLQCPGPLMAVFEGIQDIEDGQLLKVIATDYGFVNDVKNWCETNNHSLVAQETKGSEYISIIRKGGSQNSLELSQSGPALNQKNATLVVFSGEMDKVLAALIIAQGAVAQGKNVTLFFTFWGLNALRKSDVKVRNKTFMEKMFGAMMPKGSKKLPLSNMNMLGMGPVMIKGIMKKKHVDDLDTMIKKSQKAGVRFIACTMSMDLMGIKKEELIDGIEYAGVATYISSNENVGTTLFV